MVEYFAQQTSGQFRLTAMAEPLPECTLMVDVTQLSQNAP
jgi:hypothetical protein